MVKNPPAIARNVGSILGPGTKTARWRAAKPMGHDYGAHTLQSMSLEPVLCNRGSHAMKSLRAATKTHSSQK